MWDDFKYGSSSVDWCEENYKVSTNIAEFVNTVTNVLFVVIPPVMIHLFEGYSHYVNPFINIVWLLHIFIGLSSIYFHATLSLVGQLLDENSILWLCSIGLSMFVPRRHFPKFLNGNRKTFSVLMGMATTTCSILSFFSPIVNAFALMIFLIPGLFLLYSGLQLQQTLRVHRLGIGSALALAIALICWFVDRFLCTSTFPYLHGLWHVFIFISTAAALVLFAYFIVQEEYPNRVPELKYWPNNNIEFGIPYVSVKSYYKSDKDRI